MFFAYRAKKPLHTGVRTGCHHLISLCVRVTFVVFTDCESCTRPISTNLGSMEAGEYGLTRGTCFVACRMTLVVFTDCESCTRPISTNPGSMKAGEHGLTRGTCFVAHRLEVVAVAGLLWISWCVSGAAGFRGGGRGFVCFSWNAHGLLQP